MGFPSNSVLQVAEGIKALRHYLRHHHRNCKMQNKEFLKCNGFSSFGDMLGRGAFLSGGKRERARNLLSFRKDYLLIFYGGSFLQVGGLLFMHTANC